MRALASTLASLALVSCQAFLVFDSNSGAPADGSFVGSPDADALNPPDGAAAIQPLRCDPSAAFAPGKPLSFDIDAPAGQTSIRLSEDETTAFFAVSRHIAYGTRSSDGDSWHLSNIDVADPNGYVANPFVSGDLLLFHASLPLDIFAATLDASRSTATGTQAIGANSPQVADADPWLLPSGVLYFAQKSGSLDTWRIVRSETIHATADAVHGLASGNLVSPLASSDEQTLYFASDKHGSPDIYRAHRDSPTSWVVKELTSLNEPTAVEYPRWISADDCVLYYVRGSSIDDDGVLYRAQRTP